MALNRQCEYLRGKNCLRKGVTFETLADFESQVLNPLNKFFEDVGISPMFMTNEELIKEVKDTKYFKLICQGCPSS